MIEIEKSETLQLSQGLTVGDRTLFVASRVLTLADSKTRVSFAGLISPIALIVEEGEQYRVFPIDIEEEKERTALDDFIKILPNSKSLSGTLYTLEKEKSKRSPERASSEYPGDS